MLQPPPGRDGVDQHARLRSSQLPILLKMLLQRLIDEFWIFCKELLQGSQGSRFASRGTHRVAQSRFCAVQDPVEASLLVALLRLHAIHNCGQLHQCTCHRVCRSRSVSTTSYAFQVFFLCAGIDRQRGTGSLLFSLARRWNAKQVSYLVQSPGRNASLLSLSCNGRIQSCRQSARLSDSLWRAFKADGLLGFACTEPNSSLMPS